MQSTLIARLKKFAPDFDILLDSQGDRIHFKVQEEGRVREFSVDKSIADARLTAEFCAKTAAWVCFRVTEDCAETLDRLTDERLTRLAQLYQRGHGGLSRPRRKPLSLATAEACPCPGA